jgi:glycosyltransferase involved in cell wall biosynthesis
LTPDAIYGHFIASSGMCAGDIGEVLSIPSFLAYGESSTENFLVFSRSFIAKKLSKLNGVISVSSENKRELLDLKLINNSNDIGVFPNGIDNTRFYKIDKGIARKQLGIDDDKFVVAFAGHFIERKGVIVLSDALNQLQNVYSIFIGAGSDEPQCKNILFKGRVPHEQVHIYLNAADVFVLPTLAEGCCNAIIEAMACGLPIISSDQPFNDDILNTENSIRLDVKDVEAIRQAIVLLRDNPQLRSKMSEVALISASSLNIKQRAQNIIEFMESKI